MNLYVKMIACAKQTKPKVLENKKPKLLKYRIGCETDLQNTQRQSPQNLVVFN